MKNPEVRYVAPVYSQGANSVNYFIRLSDPSEREGKTATQIADNFNHIFENSSVDDVYFDVNASTVSPGPPNAIFPISIGIKSPDLAVQREVATDVTTILSQICKNDKSFNINPNCAIENKVVVKIDNGQGAQANKYVEVRLDRAKLATNPVDPIALREQLADLYQLNNGEELAKFKNNNEQLPIVIAQSNHKPNSVAELQAVPVATLSGQSVPLGQIADVREVESPGSIRQVDGEAVGVVTAKVQPEFSDQQNAALIQQKVIEEFNANYKSKYPSELVVEGYSEGDVASIAKSFSELGIGLLLAIILTYLLLVIFFNSLSMPLVILFAIPLTFLGIFPGLAYLAGGQLGFLEIIGIIILVGLVENVAIFLIDAANRKEREGWKPKDAIAYASGVRFRPIILTKVMAIASLAPLAILSEFYRSLSVVIIFGLLTSGILSLFVTPILYIAFQEFSHKIRHIGRRKKA
jgi:HAE1 family hydrophobic/amphiphilic exporter-1